ncbi:MAG: DNA primase [Oscillochloridaceae bacterium]|nr:DNA primase [Chloroflexaceae bacterium]MDW8391588.1 DNA primase [Oscillochloridaceae bacterium]
MNQIDDVRNRTDIVELITSMGVGLRRTGRSYVGFCPFHPNTRTPAFTVYPETQSFYCFGCHASGTVFDFVMRKQGLDFRGALELLAARAGVTLAPRSDSARQEDARRARLLELNALAARVFNHILLATRRGEPGRAYLEQRQVNAEMVDAFQLGYAPDERRFLLEYLTEKKGYTPEEVEAAGLAVRHESGRFYDRFRSRLIFPIRNAKGETVGFGGRIIGDGQPKYLNSPETPVFKKGELLYGLDLAREAIRTEDRTIVVEGYFDVISAHQHGFRNVVAPLGTALTRGHVALLKRLSHNVLLALDADAAGQRATLKGLDALRESAEADGRMVATAQGIVRLESDVALRIIRMPEGRDPDEVIRADPKLWQRLVAEAAPVMEFYLSAYTAGLDLSRPEEQRLALDRLLPLVAELDATQQRVYLSRLEQVIGVRAELILDLLRGNPAARRPVLREGKGRSRLDEKRPAAPPPPDEAPHPAGDGAAPAASPHPALDARRATEAYLLALALYHPSVDAAVEAYLEAGLARHPSMRGLFGGGLEDLLEEPLHRELWRHFTTLPPAWRPATPEEVQAWAEGQDEPFRETALRLLAVAGQRPQTLRYRHEAEACARKLRLGQIEARISRLKEREQAIEDAEEFEHIARMQASLALYRATVQRPRRSSTFPDARDTLGEE